VAVIWRIANWPNCPGLTAYTTKRTMNENLSNQIQLFKSVFKGREDVFAIRLQPTNKTIVMEVIDIIQLRDKKYIGHWGNLDLHSLITQLTA
jgi:hypothetical protein